MNAPPRIEVRPNMGPLADEFVGGIDDDEVRVWALDYFGWLLTIWLRRDRNKEAFIDFVHDQFEQDIESAKVDDAYDRARDEELTAS